VSTLTLAPVAHSNGSPGASRRTGAVPAASSVRTSGSAQASTVDVTTPRVLLDIVLVVFCYMIKEAFISLIKR
jgi:hypothetical protein